MSDEATRAAEAIGADMLGAAKRVVAVIRGGSPGVDDAFLARALLVSAGLLTGNAAFPNLPTKMEDIQGAAKLFVAGIYVGRDDRMKTEKESCQGAA